MKTKDNIIIFISKHGSFGPRVPCFSNSSRAGVDPNIRMRSARGTFVPGIRSREIRSPTTYLLPLEYTAEFIVGSCHYKADLTAVAFVDIPSRNLLGCCM